MNIPYLSSDKNRYIHVEVASGGYWPIWKPILWWTGGRITFITPFSGYTIYFPDCDLIDLFAHTVANIWNLGYIIASLFSSKIRESQSEDYMRIENESSN